MAEPAAEVKIYTVHARWDEESRTWWTNGADIPGLTCQGDTFDELAEAVFELGPELLRAKGIEPAGQAVAITVVAERHGSSPSCLAQDCRQSHVTLP